MQKLKPPPGKSQVYATHKHIDPRLVGTRRVMMLAPNYLTNNQSEECWWSQAEITHSVTLSLVYMKSLQPCLTLCDPMDYSPLGFSVHAILQARILKWVSMPFSRGSSTPRDLNHVFYISCIDRWALYHWHHLGSPTLSLILSLI